MKNRTVNLGLYINYMVAILVVLAIKVFYRTADSDMLLWILTPTAWWVRILSGISFKYVSHIGYVSHEYRFIIAASCSGVRFWLLTFVMMVFSYTYLIDSQKKRVYWLGLSAVFSYITTVFVNGIRITVSIYLPLMLADKVVVSGWLTAEKLHTIIGTSIYFSMLFVIYYMAGKCCACCFGHTKAQRRARRFLIPIFWYFLMVLGIPFVGRLYRNDWTGFWQYALLVITICCCVVLLFSVWGNLWRLRK